MDFLGSILDEDDEEEDDEELKWCGIVSSTLGLRDEYKLPENYLVIYCEDEDYFALDCSEPTEDGEYPVYAFHTYTENPMEEIRKAFDSYEEFFCHYFNVPDDL